MTASHLNEPSCIWRDRRDPPPATTGDYWPGDQVTLCTADRVWTVAGTHDDDTVTLSADIPDLRVHRAHLDPAATAEVDGQLSIFDALEETQ